jgi:hypothetical protein
MGSVLVPVLIVLIVVAIFLILREVARRQFEHGPEGRMIDAMRKRHVSSLISAAGATCHATATVGDNAHPTGSGASKSPRGVGTGPPWVSPHSRWSLTQGGSFSLRWVPYPFVQQDFRSGRSKIRGRRSTRLSKRLEAGPASP